MTEQLATDQFKTTVSLNGDRGGCVAEIDVVVTVDCGADGEPIIDNIAVDAIKDGRWRKEGVDDLLDRILKDWIWDTHHDHLNQLAWKIYLDRRIGLNSAARADLSEMGAL